MSTSKYYYCVPYVLIVYITLYLLPTCLWMSQIKHKDNCSTDQPTCIHILSLHPHTHTPHTPFTVILITSISFANCPSLSLSLSLTHSLSVITHTFMTFKRRPTKNTAGLLLCAILSDTLNLQVTLTLIFLSSCSLFFSPLSLLFFSSFRPLFLFFPSFYSSLSVLYLSPSVILSHAELCSPMII